MKASYGRGGSALGAAKAHVRYIAHRPDPWGNVAYRELWSPGERIDKRAAYDQLDRAADDGTYIYRLVLSPDPRTQDADKDLDLRAWSVATMDEAAAAHPGLRWFATEHHDQDHRHVHVVALSRQRFDVADFRAMRRAADDNAREQLRQRERDQVADRDR